jgi:hypothetical protein
MIAPDAGQPTGGPGVANRRTILRTTTYVAMAALIAACSGAAASAPPPTSPPTATPAAATPATPATTPAPSIAIVASAPPATPAPTSKPRPSLDIDLAELDAYMTSSITLLDLADEDLAVVVTYLDPGSDAPFPLGTFTLGSMDQVTNGAPPGAYTLEFHQPADSASATSCTIQIADEEGYVFAALGDAIAITSSATQPKTAGDLFVATSALCVD